MRTLLVVMALSVFGCKADPLKQHTPAAQAKMAALQAIAGRPIPDLTDDTLAYSGPLHESGMTDGDTAVFTQEGLAHLGSDATGALIPSEFTAVQAIGWVNAGQVAQFTPKIAVDEAFAALDRVQKVLVIRTREWVKPEIGEGDKFKPGSYRGEAHLFDLAGKYYGGVRFAATNSSNVQFEKGVDQVGKEHWRNDRSAVDNDLALRAWKALGDALVKRVPSAKLVPH